MNKVCANALNNKGQIVLLLLLIMLVALTIALAITQRSLSDLTSSNKSEQSSRAFSAAEAGIERAISGSVNNPNFQANLGLTNQSNSAFSSQRYPKAKEGVEYPPIGKDTIAQFWLMDPYDSSNYPVPNPSAPNNYPMSAGFYVYFANLTSYSAGKDSSGNIVYPAIEVNFITYNSTNKVFNSYKEYYDPSSTRSGQNGFNKYGPAASQTLPAPFCNTTSPGLVLDTSEGPSRSFACRVQVSSSIDPNINPADLPVIVRVRILYTDISQPVAIAPPSSATVGFPPQVTIFTSTGTAGAAQKRLRVFQTPYVVPSFFDYAIFSSTDVNKCSSC